MRLNTRDFGTVEVADEEIITFAGPVFGFEQLRQYVLLSSEDTGDHFVWMQSVEDASVCFILADPVVLAQPYNPVIPASADEILGKEDCICWLVTVIQEDFKQSTVNLKSPIVINPARKLGAQIILEDDYPVRYPLFTEEKGRAEEC